MARRNKEKISDPTFEYADGIARGREIACKFVKLACRRHILDTKNHGFRYKEAGLWFDRKAAGDAIDFFPTFLLFYEGEFDGKPFTLEPWQKFIIGSIFGWKLGNVRRFRTAYVEIAKGNGKSPLAAGIGLFGMLADDEPGAEIYAAATMLEQAGILFRDAKAFVEGSPSLQRKLSVGIGKIEYPDKHSFFKPVSSEHRGLDGKRPHMALIDEIHEHPNAMVVDKMRAGTKGRRQALIFEITNAGYDRHSICFQHHEYTEKILNGILENDAWFGFMTGLDVCEKCASEGKTTPQDGCPDCDDWRDEEVWLKANPNLGISIKKKYLEEQVNEAVEMPGKENIVKRLNFCVWTDSVTIWIPAEKWAACADQGLKIEDFRGKPCCVGVDLASRLDICAVIYLFDTDRGFVAFGKYYLCEQTINESKNLNYKQWVKSGHIIKTPGGRTDFFYIENDLKAMNSICPIIQLAFDPKEATYLTNNIMQWLEPNPDKPERVIEINQGPALISEPMKELEARIYTKTIWHNGDPVLAWMISNVVKKESRSGDPVKYYYPTKTSYANKIDGAVALIMAVGRAMRPAERKFEYTAGAGFASASASEPEVPREEPRAPAGDEIPCKRCGKDVKGLEFCKNCGTKVNI